MLPCDYYPLVGKWIRIDRRYNNPYRLTRYAKRVITTWAVIVIVVIALTGATHGWFAIPAGLAVAVYAGYRVHSRRRVLLADRPAVRPARAPLQSAPWVAGAWARLDAATRLAARPVLAPGPAGLAVLGPGRPGAGG